MAPDILNNWARMSLAGLFALFAVASTSVLANQDGVLPDYVVAEYGTPPEFPEGPLSEELSEAVTVAFKHSIAPIGGVTRLIWGEAQTEALSVIAESGDARVAWIITDLMRFVWDPALNQNLTEAASQLLGKDWDGLDSWGAVTDQLIAWEVPAFPGYLDVKRSIFTNAIHGWDLIFAEGDIDWRMVSWGGVPIDARPYGQTDIPCNCIPGADNPEVSNAEEAKWLDDDDVVFGIAINGEARAYPRRIMEVREMVNDTLGGRHLGIPYCTLCGAAQAYFTDNVDGAAERPVLRTSGLLIRSNKVMFDVNSYSVFDTFLGKAVTGPLWEAGVQLEQASVLTTSWGEWKAAYPETTVLVEELALGRDFDFRNGRDADGPIFPVGDVDPRLPIQEDIIGAITANGTPVAFQRSTAFLALRAGEEVTFEDVRLIMDGGGIRAVNTDGTDLGSHQAFWFAWSQFHPGTALWKG